MIVLYSLKCIQFTLLIWILHKWYFPYERIIYMEYRFWFELGLWITFIFHCWSKALFLSLLYSLSCDAAFLRRPRCDEIYTAILVFVPMTWLLSLILTFTGAFGFYSIYLLLIFFICIVIIANAILKLKFYHERSNNDVHQIL